MEDNDLEAAARTVRKRFVRLGQNVSLQVKNASWSDEIVVSVMRRDENFGWLPTRNRFKIPRRAGPALIAALQEVLENKEEMRMITLTNELIEGEDVEEIKPPHCRTCGLEIHNSKIRDLHKVREQYHWSHGLGYLCEKCGGLKEEVCAKCNISISPRDDTHVLGSGEDYMVGIFSICKSCHDAEGCDGKDHYKRYCPKFSDVESMRCFDDLNHAHTCRVCGDTSGVPSMTGGWEAEDICPRCGAGEECRGMRREPSAKGKK